MVAPRWLPDPPLRPQGPLRGRCATACGPPLTPQPLRARAGQQTRAGTACPRTRATHHTQDQSPKRSLYGSRGLPDLQPGALPVADHDERRPTRPVRRRPGSPQARTLSSSKAPPTGNDTNPTGAPPLTPKAKPAMLTDTSRWSYPRGNDVVPSRWQATHALMAERVSAQAVGLPSPCSRWAKTESIPSAGSPGRHAPRSVDEPLQRTVCGSEERSRGDTKTTGPNPWSWKVASRPGYRCVPRRAPHPAWPHACAISAALDPNRWKQLILV